jgi:hypothetical protein
LEVNAEADVFEKNPNSKPTQCWKNGGLTVPLKNHLMKSRKKLDEPAFRLYGHDSLFGPTFSMGIHAQNTDLTSLLNAGVISPGTLGMIWRLV